MSRLLFPCSHSTTEEMYLADAGSRYLRPCGPWTARLTLDEWLELRVLRKSICIDPRTMAAAYRDCFNNSPRRRSSTSDSCEMGCQQLVLRAARKHGAVGASDVHRRLGKLQRSHHSVADVSSAMRELVSSGEAEWADVKESTILAISPIAKALDLAGAGKCVYSFRELQLALIDLGHKAPILRDAERWDFNGFYGP